MMSCKRKIWITVILAWSVAVMGQTTLILQNGVDGYTGFSDKELRVEDANYYSKVPPSDSVMFVMRG